MKISSCAKLFSIGLLVSTSVLTLGIAEESAEATLRFTVPSRANVESAAVEFKEFREGEEAVSAIPKSAIIRENGKTYVLAQPDEKSATFERWEVTLGYSQDADHIEALTGVFPGDKVATSGFEKFVTQRSAIQSNEADKRVVVADGDGVIIQAPSKPTAQTEPTAKAPVASAPQQRNRFGYQDETRAERAPQLHTDYSRYAGPRYNRLPMVSSYDFPGNSDCNSAPCDNYDYVPSYDPSCDFSDRGYSYDASPDYCPNDGHGYWGH